MRDMDNSLVDLLAGALIEDFEDQAVREVDGVRQFDQALERIDLALEQEIDGVMERHGIRRARVYQRLTIMRDRLGMLPVPSQGDHAALSVPGDAARPLSVSAPPQEPQHLPPVSEVIERALDEPQAAPEPPIRYADAPCQPQPDVSDWESDAVGWDDWPYREQSPEAARLANRIGSYPRQSEPVDAAWSSSDADVPSIVQQMARARRAREAAE